MKWMKFWIGAALCAGCATTGQTVSHAGAGKGDPQAEAMGHYLSSVVHQKLGQMPKAIEDLRAAADLAPQSERLTMQLLGAYYLNEDYANAATMAERAVKNDPKNVILHVWLGRIYYQLKRFDDATAAFGDAVNLDPDNTMAYEALAQIEEETNDLAGAADTYRKLIEITPKPAFLYYRLGASLVQTDDPAGARAALEKALELNPALTPARYLLGLIYMEDGKYDAATDQLQRFLKETPNSNVPGQVNLAAARARQGKYDEAIDGLTRVIEGPEVKTEHHLLRTALLIRRGGHIDAGQSIAPNDAPLLGTLFNALARKASGEPYRPPLDRLDTVEGDLDGECNAYLNRIVSLFGKEFGAFLAEQIDSVLKEGVHSRTVEMIHARSLMAIQKREEAIEALNGTLSRFGGDKWLHYYLATMHEDLKQPEATEENLRAALKFDPNAADILNFLGYYLADKNKNVAEAKELVERALQMEPENGFYLDSLGWVYYRMGKGAEAVENIRHAIKVMNTDDATLRDHLGDAYFLSGDTAAAIKEWQRALRLDSKIQGVEEKIRKHSPKVSE